MHGHDGQIVGRHEMSNLPLIVQLQRDAVDATVSTSTLLRKAKIAAVKLDAIDIVE
jgi:hypothetical protein